MFRILLLASAKNSAISATQANRRLPRGRNRRHQTLIHDPRQDHQSHVARFGVGDAQSMHEFTFFTHHFQGARQCAPSAMHHHNLMPIVRQLNHRLRTFLQRRLVFYCSPADFDDNLHCNPSLSSHPYIRFMFCTACPAAPFSRLSRQETTTSRRPSRARQKPRSQ